MRARITTFFLAAAAVASPVGAQDYTWRWDRADSYAPIGVQGDRVLSLGEFLISYRFQAQELDGIRLEETELGIDEVLDIFQSTPYNMTEQVHRVGVQIAPMQYLTLMATVPFVQRNMDQVTRQLDLFSTSTSGIGDIEVGALFNVYEVGPYKAHVGGAVSVPTGSIEEDGQSAFGSGRLPYSMQLGSGTFDLLPSLTFQAMNQYGSVGFQGRGVIRTSENDSGYTLGNRVEVTSWFAFPINDQLSFSARMVWQKWDAISGSDPALDAAVALIQDPSVFPDLVGGSRLDLPLGLNLNLQNGPLAGHRVGVEAVFPVSESLDGPQLQQNWTVNFGWQKPLNW
ncbi:MAG: transporter [Gemmatimonadota bacterium]